MKFLKSEAFAPRLEVVIAVLLGVTAVLTAWAAWQSSLYGGNQASCYAEGTAMVAAANSLYNEADQLLMQDMEIWNKITALRIELDYEWKLDQVMADNVYDEFSAAIDWADAQTEYASPFEMEGYVDSYYTDAAAMYDEGYAKIAEGDEHNHNGDVLGLVTVIFAVVLFLLGIANSFKNNTTKFVISIVSFAALVWGVVVMIGIPIVSLN
jgi:hypothetical protein